MDSWRHAAPMCPTEIVSTYSNQWISMQFVTRPRTSSSAVGASGSNGPAAAGLLSGPVWPAGAGTLSAADSVPLRKHESVRTASVGEAAKDPAGGTAAAGAWLNAETSGTACNGKWFVFVAICFSYQSAAIAQPLDVGYPSCTCR